MSSGGGEIEGEWGDEDSRKGGGRDVKRGWEVKEEYIEFYAIFGEQRSNMLYNKT